MSTTPHPTWCNTKHKPGANPARQDHLNRWRSAQKSLPLGVDAYPCHSDAVIVSMRVTSDSPNRHAGEIGTVMGAAELRDLGTRLIEMADAADLIKRERD